MGFHGDGECLRVLGSAINLCRKGQLALRAGPGGKAQTAQAQVQTMQAQAEAFRASAAQASAQAQQFETASRMQAQANGCINNLRQIDGAIQQWALENKQNATSRVTMADIQNYLKVKPICPAGGIYTVTTVSIPPTCSVPGHVLPKGP